MVGHCENADIVERRRRSWLCVRLTQSYPDGVKEQFQQRVTGPGYGGKKKYAGEQYLGRVPNYIGLSWKGKIRLDFAQSRIGRDNGKTYLFSVKTPCQNKKPCSDGAT